MFIIPYREPHGSHHEAGDAQAVGQWLGQVEHLTGDEYVGDEREPVVLLLADEIDGDGPESEHGESLVRPSQVLPDGVEAVGIAYLPDEQGDAAGEQREADLQALRDGSLVHLQPLGHNQAGRAQGSVAGGDGSCHHAEHGQDGTSHTEPVVAHEIDHCWRRGVEAIGSSGDKLIAGRGLAIKKPYRHRGPYQRHGPLGNHRPEEQRPSHAFVFDAAGHQRALRGVEARDGTAGDGDEQHGEDAVGPTVWLRRGPHVVAVRPQFGQRGPVEEEPHHQRPSHEQQRQGEQRIDLADDLVDGQHRGDEVIAEDDDDPHHGVAADGMENQGGAIDEHRSHQDEQQHRDHQHHVLRGRAQIVADHLGQSRAVVAHGEHAAQIVVDGSSEDAAEDNPQIGRRTELRAHDGTEDGPRARDVEELDHEDLPSGHHDVVQPIGLADGGRHAVVGAEYALNKAAVEDVT